MDVVPPYQVYILCGQVKARKPMDDGDPEERDVMLGEEFVIERTLDHH
eukprot:CAMPEP_0197860734 /NCGR_PEP_ID=MMETSP1438-20131217/36344_1 /TAXON_ID=1461541 /ORGANISM="Pterosperma sp., Strain CCMP1384" /LENGTH=47 /DNA_ID= /DNA_START= /DNA_END= /DNA_ORIENTATION=